MATSGRGSRSLAIGSLSLLAALGVAVPATAASQALTTAHPAPAAAQPARIQQAVDDAAAYARSRGYVVGIGVVDVATGQAYGGGRAEAYFPTESTIKVMLATHLLAHDQMSGSTEATARRMLQASDDAAAGSLYWDAGGDGVLTWAANHYGIPALGTGPKIGPGWWGSFTASPVGFARFLAEAKDDPDVGPWLVRTMAGARPTAVDGTAQLFGLDAADPTSAAKTGWGHSLPGGGWTGTPTVGWARSGRYAVAIFTGRFERTSYAPGMAVTTAAARIVVAGLP